jgi:LacI family transcriptional regulator, repressor for deo operon, udp, cdd, tsx, nupC, and nupG
LTDRPDDEAGGPAEVNMADVAREAGVSIATVSRALRDVPGVSQGTRDRIRQIAMDLSYVISPEASALSRGHTGRVAIVMPKLDAWFYGAMLTAMAPVLRDAELDMLVYQVANEEERTRFLRELPARRKADAVILTALPMAQTEVERLDLMGVHVVVAGGTLRDYPYVAVDELEIGKIAVRHLIDLGHRRIAMIRTSDTDGTAWSSDVMRTQAWREAMQEAGLEAPDELLISETYAVDAGARGVQQLLALDEPPTAVFAYSDEIAFAAMVGARNAGVSVPEELSVIGVDGHPLGPLADITTVDQDVAGQGRLAAQMAVRLVTGEPVEDVTVAPRLVERGSTAPPPR